MPTRFAGNVLNGKQPRIAEKYSEKEDRLILCTVTAYLPCMFNELKKPELLVHIYYRPAIGSTYLFFSRKCTFVDMSFTVVLIARRWLSSKAV